MKTILKLFTINTIKVVLWVIILMIPLVGVWSASSMAAFVNSIPWLAVVAGLMLFPLLPLGWDVLSEFRRRKKAAAKKKESPRILTFWDRLLLRTLFLNLTFVLLLVFVFPQQLVQSLIIRGDWFLDGQEGPTAQKIRGTLLGIADSLDWLWQAAEEENPFEEMNENTDQPPPPKAAELDTMTEEVDVAEVIQTAPEERDPRRWPLEPALSPQVAEMPDSAKTSIQSAAQYLASQESDPFLLVRAIHDFIADRVAYDAVALAEGRYPPQDAETVFAKKIGVCAGYANLFVAMTAEVGIEAVFVGGDSRDMDGNIAGVKHAWNAVKIQEKWFLLDATWNAGHVDGDTFVKSYSNDYLFTPPEVFALNHFPSDEGWQLLEKPISRGEFVRQVPIRPSFLAAGFALVSPTRSQVTVDSTLDLKIDNTGNQFLLVNHKSKDGDEKGECEVHGESTLTATCQFPNEGTYLVQFWIGTQRIGNYAFAGQIEVNNSP